MPIIVLGGIYSGIMTPTEAAAVSRRYALPVGMFIYKGITLNGLRETLIDGVMPTGAIMIMLFSCSVISRIYIMNDLPRNYLRSYIRFQQTNVILYVEHIYDNIGHAHG